MANQIKAPINYPIIAGGKIVAGGSVLFGQPNVKPDEDNPSTLKAVYLDAALTRPAQNPQGLSSDGVFDQSDTGILFGSDNTVYSIVIKGANKKELSYIPEYDLSDANAAATAQDAAAAAASSEANALSFKNLTEALYTDFTNRYFGPFSSDPSVDDLGNPPNEGSIYFNSTSNVFFTWNGSAWINYFPSNPNGLLVTATGTTTPRTLGDRGADTNNIIDHGGVGDGVTNNDSALTLANAIGKPVYVPLGNFLITSTTQLTGDYYGEGSFNGIPVSKIADGTLKTVRGFDAGKNITVDNLETTLYGRSCGRELTTGTRNTGVGQGVFSGDTLKTAGPWPVTGSNNVGVGFHALKKMQSGIFNIGIGTDAGNEITSGGSNTLLGGSAGQQITIGFDNTMIGRSAGLRSGLDASSLDPDTYVDLNGTENVLVGRDAGRNFYDASYNVVLGSGAMRGTKDESDFTGNMTGNYNVVLGYRAMYTGPTSAAFNVVLGEEAGKEITTAANNVIIGSQAARDNQTGSGNIIIGHLAYRTVVNPENKIILSNTSGLPLFDGDSLGGGNAGNAVKIDGNLSAASDNVRSIGTAVRRYASGFVRQLFTGDGSTVITSGAGSPEGVLSAPIGSMYTRTDGGSGTTLYIKESGAGSTGWVAK